MFSGPSRWLPPVFFAAALAGALWRIPAAPPAEFVPPAPPARTLPPSPAQADWLPTAMQPSAPSLAELPDGRIAAAWLASAQDNNDLWFSVAGSRGWQPATRIATRETTAGANLARIDRLDAPVLYAEGGWLHLWYATTAIGNELGRALQHSVSTDGGAGWSKPARQPTAPWPLAGTRLSAPPAALDDGGLALPLSHRFIQPRAGWLRLSATGQIVDQPRLPAAGGTPPVVAVVDGQHALAVMPAPGQPATATTADGGQFWQAGPSLPLPLAESPLAMIRLRSGRLLLAGNDSGGRQALRLWLADTPTAGWRLARTVEAATDGGAEFAQPALLQGRDGRVHLAYAWRRQRIRHVAFGEDWLDGGPQ